MSDIPRCVLPIFHVLASGSVRELARRPVADEGDPAIRAYGFSRTRIVFRAVISLAGAIPSVRNLENDTCDASHKGEIKARKR